MQTIVAEDMDGEATKQRTASLFHTDLNQIHQRADHLFSKLMVFQWLAGLVIALWISPKTWVGPSSQIHWHIWAALFIGGAITSFPVFLIWKYPGRTITRHSIAVGQMLMSALLIHLMGGRVESHFHVFGSLAFLAFYRDWKVMISATVVVALDHFLRGVFWPQSVFGVLTASPWRWTEHAGWVIFEDFFLLISIRQSLQEMRAVAQRQAKLELINQNVEKCVEDRTKELRLEIQERKEAEAKLESTHQKLVTASRQAGMAEVATAVLHNVGNVLNSVNVSTNLLAQQIKKSTLAELSKLAGLLDEHVADLPSFFAQDPRARKVPDFVRQLCVKSSQNQDASLQEITSLQNNVAHIKDIVAMQQSYATISGVSEIVDLAVLMEDTLGMSAASLTRHDVQVIREFEKVPPITTDKHKVLQILVNLVRNGKQACDAANRPEKKLTFQLKQGQGSVLISVLDNGVGIPQENLTRIFNHGFTTKKDGHGFGLHNGALAARELGGSLTVRSDGPGTGAAFTLELPCDKSRN
ncbi:MAG TPA: ATP-binding protein [Verrucomicrobiae bacterium]|jgi:signal transduction histidine kinase